MRINIEIMNSSSRDFDDTYVYMEIFYIAWLAVAILATIIMWILDFRESNYLFMSDKQRKEFNQPLHSETNSTPGPLQLSPAQDSPQPTSSANGARPDLSPKSQNEGSRKTAAELNAWKFGYDLGDYSSKGKCRKLVLGLKVC